MGGARKRARASSRRDASSKRGARTQSPFGLGVQALRSFLESHGCAAPPPGDEPDEDGVAARIAGGPVPPEYLLTLAARSNAPFISLIEEASVLAREADPGARRPSERRTSGDELPSLDAAFARLFAALGEERLGQVEMARSVDRALRESAVALVEAGTGTGKSLGYLVPAALFARETGERVVVSTYTKNLQDQLYRKETPLLESVVPGVRAERLLGRENYLCTRGIVSRAVSLAVDSPERALAFALQMTLASGAAADRVAAENGPARALSLFAPARCSMNACAFADRCPLMRARRRAREAEILFVNHALLLTDYRQGGGVIGPYARVIFDEAHHLERCVVENLSVKAARDDCRRILESVRLSLKNEDAWRLLVHELESGGPGEARRLRGEIADRALALERANAELFRAIEESINPERAFRAMKLRYTDGAETFALARDAFADNYITLNELNESLKLIREASLPRDLEPFRQEMIYVSEELSTLAEGLRYLSSASGEESVFWLDWGADAGLRELCGSPLDVDRSFADYVESFMGSAVLTSATLSHDGGFAFLKERLGIGLLPGTPIETIIPSPFPFDERCLVLIVTGLGDPNDDVFAARVSGIVGSLAEEVARRTMVLFTSYRLCHAVGRSLESSRAPGPVLVQGTGESRETLSGRFRRGGSSLLLGVASFWEGVDFPGEELEVLVIPKVPFPVPSEPVVEARSSRLAALGEDAFEKLFLPEAMLRMRQGAGRLIRRMDDRGVIVILDERLETRPYGPSILSALPSRTIEHVSAAECIASAVRWFEGR